MAKVKVLAKAGGPESVKHGILFTVSVLLLAFSLVSLAIVFSQQSSENKYTAIAMLDMDRVSDTYSNINTQMVRVLSEGANISVSGNYAIFNESLPQDAQRGAELDRLVMFEQNFSDLNVTINDSYLKSGSFMVQPNSVLVAHGANDFYITPQNSTQSAGAVYAYDVNVTCAAGSVNGAYWLQVARVAQGAPNSEYVHVRVNDAAYAYVQDFYETLDKNSISYLNMTQGGGQVGFVEFLPQAALQVHYAGNIGLKASVGLVNPVYIEANDTISVVGNANQTARVKIA